MCPILIQYDYLLGLLIIWQIMNKVLPRKERTMHAIIISSKFYFESVNILYVIFCTNKIDRRPLSFPSKGL
jgi:hypothetical protein